MRAQAAQSICSLRGCLAGAPKAALAALHTAPAAYCSWSSTDMAQGGGRMALSALLNLLQHAGSLRAARPTPSTRHWVPCDAHLMTKGARSATRKWSSQSPAESTTCTEQDSAMSRASLGATMWQLTLPGATVPGAWYSNIINAVRRPTVGNPGEGRLTNRPECGREAQTELHQGAVEHCAAKIFLLAHASAANSGRHRAQTSIGINNRSTTSGWPASLRDRYSHHTLRTATSTPECGAWATTRVHCKHLAVTLTARTRGEA